MKDLANITSQLLQSDRRGQSQSALRAVQGRHEAIQKIESQMIELAQLFQDMEALVVQQEPAVVQIEQKGEEVTDNVGKANVQMDGAISKARSRNRKKWWCLLILCKCLPGWQVRRCFLLTGSSDHPYHHRGRRRCGCLTYTPYRQGCYTLGRFDQWVTTCQHQENMCSVLATFYSQTSPSRPK